MAEESAQESEAAAWFEALRPLCEEGRADLRSGYAIDVVLFYLARWCQKETRSPEPELDSLAASELRDVAERIARHLARHGDLVERFVRGDSATWTDVRADVAESARARAVAEAENYADEAMQKIAEVLLTGTSPSQAAGRLVEGPRGPSNEYVFDSPFLQWARTVVINLIRDEWRRTARRSRPQRSEGVRVDRELVASAKAALPGLVDAIRSLPPLQKTVIVLSLSRSDVDEVARGRLRELAPDLFGDPPDVPITSDRDIAELLESIPHRVAANRSVARRKLAREDKHWALLLDVLLPHRSTRPVEVETDG